MAIESRGRNEWKEGKEKEKEKGLKYSAQSVGSMWEVVDIFRHD